MTQDYVVLAKSKNTELLHHGVKGMKWGVRNPRGSSSASSGGKSSGGSGSTAGAVERLKQKALGPTKKKIVETKAVVKEVKKIVKDESSIDKYIRLKKEVAKGNANKLDDDDLKFLNSRADAIKKANAAFNQQGSWLQKTVKIAIDSAAQKLLKDVTQGLATKHVANRLHTKLKLPPPPGPKTPTPDSET